ncbi:hypothetical protein IEN85_16240 [Pelagicoccus sp. NFK12]|uniref:Uncharacterized protein n=1 Tax=Pelagicoccus enzymogenes TaxID=2773457 RepID=A0A927IJ08_9BACT|nr:hypothetical protein [Pelagicoccus enzymogenes]MBD5781050.1 hypothetical protein [Pelagicoccus enzymogenes]
MKKPTAIVKIVKSGVTTSGGIQAEVDYLNDEDHKNHFGVEMTGVRYSEDIRSNRGLMEAVLMGEKNYLENRSQVGRPWEGELVTHYILAFYDGMDPSGRETELIEKRFGEALSFGSPYACTTHKGYDGRVDQHYLVSNFSPRDPSRLRKTLIAEAFGGDFLRHAKRVWEGIVVELNCEREIEGRPLIVNSDISQENIDHDSISKEDIPRIIAATHPQDAEFTKDSVLEAFEAAGVEANSYRSKKSVSVFVEDRKMPFRFRWTELLGDLSKIREKLTDEEKERLRKRLEAYQAGKEPDQAPANDDNDFGRDLTF